MYKFVLAVEQQTAASFDFKRKLVIATSQFINYFPKCELPFKILISAGLPHFSVGWTRCWGRDTFTCTDLLLLHPHIMKDTIIQFAAALRHGLIPNLLDEGKRPRYNSRDACWWFLRSIGEYLSATKDYDLLKSKVDMIFLSNDVFEHNQLKR
jgi:glycogen debranching enzyme